MKRLTPKQKRRLDEEKHKFAEGLKYYIQRGQRGDGTPEDSFEPWKFTDFASHIDSGRKSDVEGEVTPVSPNSVKNWIEAKSTPDRIVPGRTFWRPSEI